MASARFGIPVPSRLQAEAATARGEAAQARDRHLSEKAKLDTFANDGALGDNFAAYDARLESDARDIIDFRRSYPKLPLRPHYRNLIEAYEDEFVHNRGLRDPKVIAFFDRYVHDSLAGFAQDATLPSDPRVIYAGGDNKIKYANLDRAPDQPKSA